MYHYVNVEGFATVSGEAHREERVAPDESNVVPGDALDHFHTASIDVEVTPHA